MADWIKTEKTTPRKPEVLKLATLLEVHPDHALGLCIRWWMWCDDHLQSCHAADVTLSTVDLILGHAGFASALVKVGWLHDRSGALEIPRFDRHLSKGAKTRALTTERKQKQRDDMSRSCHDASVTETGPEKRREDILEEREKGAGLCTLEQAVEYAPTVRMSQEQASYWWKVRNSTGWTKGSAGGGAARKITSWQDDMATSLSWVGESMQKSKSAQNQKPPIEKSKWDQ